MDEIQEAISKLAVALHETTFREDITEAEDYDLAALWSRTSFCSKLCAHGHTNAVAECFRINISKLKKWPDLLARYSEVRALLDRHLG